MLAAEREGGVAGQAAAGPLHPGHHGRRRDDFRPAHRHQPTETADRGSFVNVLTGWKSRPAAGSPATDCMRSIIRLASCVLSRGARFRYALLLLHAGIASAAVLWIVVRLVLRVTAGLSVFWVGVLEHNGKSAQRCTLPTSTNAKPLKCSVWIRVQACAIGSPTASNQLLGVPCCSRSCCALVFSLWASSTVASLSTPCAPTAGDGVRSTAAKARQ